jgi:hypothetical protein
MKFKNWLLTEEIWQNNTATVYHRTDPQNIKTILSSSWQTGTGKFYGSGLYTTFSIESQFTQYMEDQYGTSILKFKVTNLDQYVICHKTVAQQILGQNYKISDQLKKLNLTDLYTPEQIEKFDQMMETEKFSAGLAKIMHHENNSLENKAKGIIYYGSSDGYCLLKYKPIEDGTINLLGFANNVSFSDLQKMQELQTNCKKNQEGKCENPWITSTSKLAIKHLYSLPEKDREKAAENTATNADDEAEVIINQGKNIDLSIKKILQKKLPISASFKKKLLLKSENIKDILLRLFRNEDINKDFISSVLINSVNKDKIFEALGQNNIDKVADKEYRNILDYIPREYQHDFVEALIKHKKHITKELLPHGNYGINNQYGIKNVIELIFKYKPKEFTPDLIGYLMNRGILAEEFLNKFSPEIIEKIPNKYIEQFFYKTSVKRMLKLFGPEKLKSLNKHSIVNIIKENIYWTDQLINFYGNFYLNYFTHADLGKLFWNLKTQQHAEDDDALDLVFSNIQRQLTMSDAMAIADEIEGGMPQVKKAAEKHGKTIMPDL